MTELTPCRTCQHLVAPDAKTCPSCGANEPWKPQSQIDAARHSQQKSQRVVAIGCAAIVGFFFLLLIIGMMSGGGGGTDTSTSGSNGQKLRDSTECQVVAMGEANATSGPAVDRAHERCMAARGYRKR